MLFDSVKIYKRSDKLIPINYLTIQKSNVVFMLQSLNFRLFKAPSFLLSFKANKLSTPTKKTKISLMVTFKFMNLVLAIISYKQSNIKY